MVDKVLMFYVKTPTAAPIAMKTPVLYRAVTAGSGVTHPKMIIVSDTLP
jgi:hypothetical protein